MPAPELTLRRALAQILHDNNLGVYKPSGSYAAADHGIVPDGVLPTTYDNTTVLNSPPTTADGRADVIYRVQFFTRIKGRRSLVEDWADRTRLLFDQRENTPNILGISWTWETSRLYFDPDTQGRVAVSVNYAFRGRRQN